MRRVESVNGNQSGIGTGHAAFDALMTSPGTGNRSGGGQNSSYVRAFNRTECNGQTFRPGELQNYDLNNFRELKRHYGVLRAVREAATDDDVILYEFHHYRGREKMVHGYVLTHTDDRYHELIATYATGRGSKSRAVVDTMAEYVSNPPGTTGIVMARAEEVARVAPEIAQDLSPAAASCFDVLAELSTRLSSAHPTTAWRFVHFALGDSGMPSALIDPKDREHYDAGAQSVSNLDESDRIELLAAFGEIEQRLAEGFEHLEASAYSHTEARLIGPCLRMSREHGLRGPAPG